MKINEELLKDIKILYVEDDEDVTDGASKFLARRFTTVYTALNGKEGLEIFMGNRPDVVITDIRMPVMDGLDMAKKIKDISPATPIIITTAYTEVPYLMQAIEIGVDSYVLKPIVNETLYDTVRKCVSKFIFKRMMDAKNRLVQTIMDWNPCFSILISGENLDYVNKTFLNFTGYATMAEFLKHHECVDDFIVAVGKEKIDTKASDKWFKQIINNPGMDHMVYIKAKDSDNVVPYLVKHEHFREINQYIFAFICPDEAAKQDVKTV